MRTALHNPRLFTQRLEACAQTPASVREMRVGLEREALRVNAEASLSRKAHPEILGAALTHPWITTDYSEAMLELITPPAPLEEAYAFLEDLHSYTTRHLGEERLWCGSMPCVIAGDPDIPLARYGTSNAGQMKTVYRRGLGLRYSRSMQVIAGVHFNCSMPQAFWQQEFGETPTADQISERYLGALRNLMRHGWLVAYLFGASPAICRLFLDQQPSDTTLEDFTPATSYAPEATSLRLSDIGYQNSLEVKTGIDADYNSLSDYIDALRAATSTPCARYESLGLKQGDTYLQLNANCLQIENEYYGPVRPKCVPKGNEKPTRGLRLRGVQYLELRTLDIDPFAPCGVSLDSLRFLNALVLYCLLDDSPPMSPEEQQMTHDNMQRVAQHGRAAQVDLRLGAPESAVDLRTQAQRILEEMRPVCALLDQAHGGSDYTTAWESQQARVEDPEQTLSARMIEEMRTRAEAYVEWTLERSRAHQQYFLECSLTASVSEQLDAQGVASHREQREWEEQERRHPVSFEDYLAAYEAQQ